jgi:hypothetical protein
MFKKGLIFGFLGFLISLVTIYVIVPEKESTSQEVSPLSYTDGINGWISFGNILKENVSEAFLSKDELFLSMFMFKIMDPIRLPNKPEIIITEQNQSIFWTNGVEKTGTKYTGWKGEKNQNFFIKDTLSIVKIDFTSNSGRVNGYLYLILKNKPNPKEFSNRGWQYYGHVLTTSNTIRGYVNNRNSSEINKYFDKVTKKEDIVNFAILAGDKTVIWDINKSNIGKKMQGGWTEQESGKSRDNKFYFSLPVKSQERNIADAHLLINEPAKKQGSLIQNVMLKLKWIFKIQHLMIAFISFIILTIAGNVLSKTGPVARVSKGEFAKSGPGLENKVQSLKEEIEQLETTKADVMEVVAKKQKEQKDLETEIESLKTKKVTMPSQAEVETAETAEKALTKEEKEKSEEDLLFDKLLGGSNKKKSAKKKEELELTQRIVAKRREEIALSGTIETRRKELMKLEQQIEKLKKEK